MSEEADSCCLFCKIASGAISGANRIVDLPNSVAVLAFNQTFRGRSILIAREHCTDMLTLPRSTYLALCEELHLIACAIKRTLSPDRINYANFGNQTPHLHWHIIPRYRDDPRWGRPPSHDAARSWSSDAPYESLASVIRGGVPGT